jgi:hypothetical protein
VLKVTLVLALTLAKLNDKKYLCLTNLEPENQLLFLNWRLAMENVGNVLGWLEIYHQ